MGSSPKLHRNVSAIQPGFTLVEILIVVVILATLAVIVVAQFASAAGEARENSIRMSLFRIRGQLGVYQAEHNANYPDFADFEAQMTAASDADGNTAALGTPGFPFGPYLAKIPVNPKTGGTTVGAGAVGSSDWYYDETTGEFHANDSAETFAY